MSSLKGFVRGLALIPAVTACVAALPTVAHSGTGSGQLVATPDGYRYSAAAGADNDVLVVADSDSFELTDSAIGSFGVLPDGCSSIPAGEGAAVSCQYEGSTVLTVRLEDGNDLLDGRFLPATVSFDFRGGSGDSTVLGGAGDDLVVGGNDPDGNDTLYGGPGDDRIRARGGAAYLRGHAGDDQLIGGPGLDFIIGDSGADTVEGRGYLDYITGGSGADVLVGGGAYDNLDGGRGFDELFGRGGSDTLTGGTGRDRLAGGAGDDDLVTRGDGRRDVAQCGIGADTAYVDTDNRDEIHGCERLATAGSPRNTPRS